MKAYIILIWKEENQEYPRLIKREEFLIYIDKIIEDSEIARKIKSLSKKVNTISVNVDKDIARQERNLVFKYKENIDFNEDTERVEISQHEKMYYFIKSYCQEVIVFKVRENNQVRIKSKSKQQMISIMQAIKNAYPDNNEISTKLCEVLPGTYSIFINKDRNDSCPENPIIICYTVNEEKYKAITVMNNHKIIWAHINEWCK